MSEWGAFFLTVGMRIDKCGGTVEIGKSPFATITVDWLRQGSLVDAKSQGPDPMRSRMFAWF